MKNAMWDVEAARAGTIPRFLQPLDRATPMVATADIGATAGLPQRPRRRLRCVARRSGRGAGGAALGMGTDFPGAGHDQPDPRMHMRDGFNEGRIRFEGGDKLEPAAGTTTLEAVLRALLARG